MHTVWIEKVFIFSITVYFNLVLNAYSVLLLLGLFEHSVCTAPSFSKVFISVRLCLITSYFTCTDDRLAHTFSLPPHRSTDQSRLNWSQPTNKKRDPMRTKQREVKRSKAKQRREMIAVSCAYIIGSNHEIILIGPSPARDFHFSGLQQSVVYCEKSEQSIYSIHDSYKFLVQIFLLLFCVLASD